MSYAIRFEFPEFPQGHAYAGEYKGGAGFAPTLKTAWTFDTAEAARRVLRNTYGGSLAKFGCVVETENDREVAR